MAKQTPALLVSTHKTKKAALTVSKQWKRAGHKIKIEYRARFKNYALWIYR